MLQPTSLLLPQGPTLLALLPSVVSASMYGYPLRGCEPVHGKLARAAGTSESMMQSSIHSGLLCPAHLLVIDAGDCRRGVKPGE
jgi:hypothetical protein